MVATLDHSARIQCWPTFIFQVYFYSFFLVPQLKLWWSTYWWYFYVCDCLAAIQVIILLLQVMILIEEGYGKEASDGTSKADSQWRQRRSEGRRRMLEWRRKWTGKRNLELSSWVHPLFVGLAVLRDAGWSVWSFSQEDFSGRGDFSHRWVLTPFPQTSFGWGYKLRSSLCTHAFHRTDSKDPDIHVPDGWLPATKTHPACTILEDWMWLCQWLD